MDELILYCPPIPPLPREGDVDDLIFACHPEWIASDR